MSKRKTGVIMKSLVSVRLSTEVIKEMKTNARKLHMSQTDYVRTAIELMNDRAERRERNKRLKKASMAVRAESMKVNAEFSDIEVDPDA